MSPEVFPIVPASAKPIWILGAVCIILVIIFAALAYTAYSARNSRLEVGENQLRLEGDFWGRSIDFTSLQLDNAAIIDLDSSSNYAPRRRTFGTAVPGYASGWFRLRNGEKALAYLTARKAVVYIPTTLGYSLLLSTDRPQQFLDALRSRTAG
ncbi:MAG: hypothetical protein JSU95_15260 [Betaproteobacteria bacterium]|nr:MAG: hypothetical protein JSU95_15260 [Betaproteobacteria bacterium]